MRPLAFAVLVAALAGCSKPYRDTSFAALPELEAELHGKGKTEEGGEGEKQIAIASRLYNPDADVAVADTLPGEGGMNRTGIVFPPTAQPTSGAVATRLAPAERGVEAAPSVPEGAASDALPQAPAPETTPPPAGGTMTNP